MYKGSYTNDGITIDVAIKTIKGGYILMICNVMLYTLAAFAASSLLSVEEFITECNITKKFNHPNVLSIIGVSHTPEESVPLMVLPYMHHGDVKSFLTSRRGIRINMTEYPEVRKVPHILENCCDPTIAHLTTVVNINYRKGETLHNTEWEST